MKPDNKVSITRRIFFEPVGAGGAAAGRAATGWLPRINTLDIAYAQDGQLHRSFRFAWVSDTHLYPRDVNTRFVEKTVRAFKEVQAMNPAADFMIFGGDLAQLGDPVELQLGARLLKEVTIRKVFIPGEHDWYLDMGEKWDKPFRRRTWTFDHKGVRVHRAGHGERAARTTGRRRR